MCELGFVPGLKELHEMLKIPGFNKQLLRGIIAAQKGDGDFASIDECPHSVWLYVGEWLMEGKKDAKLYMCKNCGKSLVVTPYEFKQLQPATTD